MNELVHVPPQQIALVSAPPTDNPFLAHADRENTQLIVGSIVTLLKNGEYGIKGTDRNKPPVIIPLGTKMVVDIHNALTGWECWFHGERVNHALAPISANLIKPVREQLDMRDETKWESKDDGTRKDPWGEVGMMVMTNPSTGEVHTFIARSKGSRNALNDLIKNYGRHYFKNHSNEDVVISLERDGYYHKNRQYGYVFVPKFKIVGFEPKETLIHAVENVGASDVDDGGPDEGRTASRGSTIKIDMAETYREASQSGARQQAPQVVPQPARPSVQSSRYDDINDEIPF